jgi:molybdopterin molybdotransferase
VTKQFFQVKPIQDSLSLLFDHIRPLTSTETIATEAALNRILANATYSPIDLPNFDRSAMDGFAVKAADTFGASDALPSYLTVLGHINMGEVPTITVGQTETAVIHTGAMLPKGADAVVMIERTQQVADKEIEVLAPVAVGENIIKLGEDVLKDSEVLPNGHRLRPQDIGGLLAVGITEIVVYKRPKIAILSSGDELVDATETPELGQIRDINSYMLAALCETTGAKVIRLGIARDTIDSFLSLAQKGFEECDMLIISAGSSVSVRDLTQTVIQELGEPGVLQHGLAVKPGKPTIIAACNTKPVFGLPGNPVSAMLVARQVLIPTIQHLLGEKVQPISTISAKLTQNVASTSGREDSVPIRLISTENGYEAEPIWGKSNLIYTLLKADGLLHVPLNTSGYKAGIVVEVALF